jgi:YhcH/YjgK/YiaL family protein
VDVQVILEGEERMDVSQEQNLEPLGDYREDDDVTKVKAPETYSSLAMTPGMFAVFFPQDAHRPNCDLNGKTRNRKVCMKVKIK